MAQGRFNGIRLEVGSVWGKFGITGIDIQLVKEKKCFGFG